MTATPCPPMHWCTLVGQGGFTQQLSACGFQKTRSGIPVLFNVNGDRVADDVFFANRESVRQVRKEVVHVHATDHSRVSMMSVDVIGWAHAKLERPAYGSIAEPIPQMIEALLRFCPKA